MSWAERLNRVFGSTLRPATVAGAQDVLFLLRRLRIGQKWTATRRILAAPKHRCLKVLYQTPISMIDWIGQTRGPDWRGNE